MSTARVATPADLTRMCRTAMHAFAADPVMRWLFPDDEEYFGGDGSVMRVPMQTFVARGTTYVSDDGVALAAFVPPGRPDVEATEPQPETAPIVHTPERQAKFAAFQPLLAHHTPPEPHWYLNLLATHPHWQRQGLGALVMQPMFEICDRDRLPIYLETESLANAAYYGHHGFRVRSEWDVPLEGPHMWGMLREPTTPASF